MTVTKSSLYIDKIKKLYWEDGYNVKEIAKKFDISDWSLYDLMNKYDIPRRSYSEANYVAYKYKPQFEVKTNLTVDKQKLKIAGIMLYWAEGTAKGATVDFANSNSDMIKLFLKFLRQICGVNEDRLRAYIYTHSNVDLEGLKKYWHELTGIPLAQFTKPYIRKGNPNLSNRKMLHGLIHIRYNDRRLLETIDNWIKEYICSL